MAVTSHLCSVIIPTLNRVDYLRGCLEALGRQTLLPAEVVVATHMGDNATHEFLNGCNNLPYALRYTECEQAGVIANMQAAVDSTRHEVVALLDDDATPHTDWLELIERHFVADVELGGLGGRDHLKDDEDRRLKEDTTHRVGYYTWFGLGYGNHHRGCGAARRVHVVKGCNCAFRGPVLREIGFDYDLRGSGAQVGWELSLCFDLLKAGYHVVYDPSVQVDHWVAPRHDAEIHHRCELNMQSLEEVLYNDFSIFWKSAPRYLVPGHFLWAILWGGGWACGIFRACRDRINGDRTAWMRFRLVLRTLLEACSSIESNNIKP